MSMRLSNSAGEMHFDSRTGQTSYIQPRGSLLAQARGLITGVPRPVKWLLLAGVAWIAFEGTQWALVRSRSKRLRREARQCTDLEDLAALLYSIAPSHLGGFLTNATIQAIERIPADEAANDSRILLFASGGWRFTPHSLAAVPLAVPFPDSSSSADERLKWWLAVTLGKGMVLNGALAFLVANMMLRAEREGEDMPLQFRGRRIVNVGFSTGALYQNIAPLQASAAAASAAAATSPAASAAAIPGGLPCPAISRLELACEIGTLSASRVEAYRASHYGMPPDPRSEELSQCADMGTSRVLSFWRAHSTLPDASTEGFDAVLWEKRAVNPPPGRDGWMWIEVANARGDAFPTEKIHIDMGIYFARGICAGFQQDRRGNAAVEYASAEDAHALSSKPSAVSSAWSSLCSGLSRLQLRLSSLLPSSLSSNLPGRTLTSATSPLPLPSLPRPFLLPDSIVSSSSRNSLAARINDSATGARDTIALLQKLVLINASEGPNTTHAQLRSLLLEALQLRGLRNRWLTQKIPPAAQLHASRPTTPPGGASSNRERGGASSSAEWQTEKSVPSSSAHPKARQGRSARQRAQRKEKQRRAAAKAGVHDEDDDGSDSDDQHDGEDDDAIELDTSHSAPPREVDQVD